jgi:hypothetical protein
MENKNVNEEIIKELGGIKWSTDPEEKVIENESKAAETEIKNVEVNEVENKVENKVENTAGAEVENKEPENKEADKAPENKEADKAPESNAAGTETTGKKRDVLKFGNKNWVEEIPENERFTEKTVFCWKPGEEDKIGYFFKYGKKEGMIWINMYKKDTFTLMSREWAARLSDCVVIEQDGKMLSDRYFKDEKGYHVKKEDKKDEVAATGSTDAAKTPETKVEPKAEKIVDENVVPNTEMPLAE